jgi:hypothetical protein
MFTLHPVFSALLVGSLAVLAPSMARADDTEEETEVLDWQEQVPVEVELWPGTPGHAAGTRELKLVQRSTTGKVVASQVALSLLTRSVSGQGFNKENLRGTKVKSVPNPAFDTMPDQVQSALADYFSAHPAAVPAEYSPIQLTVKEFSLIYRELGDEHTDYVLQQEIDIGFPILRTRFRQLPGAGEGAKCRIDETVSAPLETWQADDYAYARQVVEQHANQCVSSFVAMLPQLFPDPQQEPADAGAASVPAADDGAALPADQQQG